MALLLLAAPGLGRGQGAEQPIPNAGGWRLTALPPSGCWARLQGAQVDTMVMVNRDQKMVVGAGRSDWSLPNGQRGVTLQIDSGTPQALEASPVGNLFIVLIPDGGMALALRKAERLRWTVPQGRFSAEVAGLGVAFDAVRACNHAAAPAGGA
jgi:hypothetical protein